ncbi:MAG: hypothetical protein ABH851_05455, partial [Methanobacteriota archaeon]
KAFAAELAPKDFRASSLGLFQMVVGLMALPSSFIAGLLWETVSPHTAFMFSASLAIISAAILMCCTHKRVK